MKIFINHSPSGELKKLKGVGPKLAARIIQYRQGGPFNDAEDLQDRVPGISAQLIRSWAHQRELIVTFEVDSEEPHGVREPEESAEPPSYARYPAQSKMTVAMCFKSRYRCQSGAV